MNVTGVCNLTCAYCYFQPRKHEHMAIADFEKVVEILKAQNLFFLTLSGGEPFMHPHINDILRHAHRAFMYTTVLSNGTILRKENLACIREIISAKGFFPMQVSLDAIDPDTNDRTRGMALKVLQNLEILKAVGVSLTIAIVVTSQNIEQVVRTVVASKHLTKHFHIMPFKPVPFLERHDQYLRSQQPDMQTVWERLQETRTAHELQISLPVDECKAPQYSATGAPCVAGFTQVVIDPNLDVRACSRCTHAVVGNLNHEKMAEIWHGPKLAYVYERELPYCYVPSEWDAAMKDPSFLAGKRGVKAAWLTPA
ncbi:MAG: radical SAM/SPASM domain-containing protein [Chloroflexota bacterium]